MRYREQDYYDLSKVIFLSWVTLFLAISSPIIFIRTSFITSEYCLFLGLISMIFYISIYAGIFVSTSVRVYQVHRRRIEAVFVILCIFLIVAKLIDRLYLRPADDLLSFSSVRSAREIESNFFSMAAALVFPLISIGYTKISGYISSHSKSVFFAAALVSSLDILFSGSRGTLLVVFIIFFSHLITKKTVILWAGTFIIAMGAFFQFRASDLLESSHAKDIIYLFSNVGYAEFVPVSSAVMQTMMNSEIPLFLFSLVHLNQYLAHGFFEFAYIFHSAPQFQISPQSLVPTLSLLGFDDVVHDRGNLYYMLFGSIYLSFGYATVVFVLILGFTLGALIRKSDLVSVNAKKITYLVIFAAPFVNSIGGFDIYLFLISIYIWSNLALK